jgi:predicted glycoside hydrolase/deacetylase ChbG (UPF0249 family)
MKPNSSLWLMASLSVYAAVPLIAEDLDPPELAIRCDDVGMCHAVNEGVRRLLATGMPFSTSVMVPCPWFEEAAEILRDQPQVSVGIHLTLNSEWQHYKWGPVIGASEVPSLVDDRGYFHATAADFAAAEVDLDEVELELRAQIERARGAGLEIDYLDYHMLTALSTPELQSLVEELAAEFGVGLSRYFGEPSISLWDVEPDKKHDTLMGVLDQLEPGTPTLLVMHLGIDGPEMAALIDVNNPDDPARVGIHRGAELAALLSPEFQRAIDQRGIRLVNYRDLTERYGLDAMRRPADSGYSMNRENEP